MLHPQVVLNAPKEVVSRHPHLPMLHPQVVLDAPEEVVGLQEQQHLLTVDSVEGGHDLRDESCGVLGDGGALRWGRK